MAVLIKPKLGSKLLIKAKASGLEFNSSVDHFQLKGLYISGLSRRANEELESLTSLDVEFVMMSSRIVFNTKILRLKSNHLLISIPKLLTNIERRKENRVNASRNLPAYAMVGDHDAHLSGLTPVFLQYKDLGRVLPIVDISLGGFCVKSPMSYVKEHFKVGYETERLNLVLPIEEPIKATVRIVWVREHTDKDVSADVVFRFGFMFLNISEKDKNKISNYIQQAVQLDAL